MRRALLATALLVIVVPCGVAPPLASAEDEVRYPFPPDIAAVIASEDERALRDAAMAALESRDASQDASWSRRLLLLLGDVGLSAAAERLSQGDVPPSLRSRLIEIVAASPHPEADLILAQAATERRPLLRMLAAHGLGRGRTAAAVPLLATLARDARSGVRAAALAALFAIDTRQAVDARLALPADPEPELTASRLAWHRRAGDASPALRVLATDTWRRAQDPTARLEAAHLLADPALGASPDLLWQIVLESGTGLLGEWLVRYGLDVPAMGYDPVRLRRIAIDAALALLANADTSDDRRSKVLALAVGWVASPVPMDPYRRDPIPELELRRLLPDLGQVIVSPVLARLRTGAFRQPSHGVALIRALGEDLALPHLVALVDPVADSYSADLDALARSFTEDSAVTALRGFGRVGGEACARRLLGADVPVDVRRDVLLALWREDREWVVPLLGEHLFTERLRADKELPDDRAELRHAARKALDQRMPDGDPTAREIVTRDLFATADDPARWLASCVKPFDEIGWTTLSRALDDRRVLFQRVALSVLAEPAARSARGAELVRAFLPRAGMDDIVHKALTALVNQAPAEAVAFVRENWDRLPARRRALEQIAGVRGAAGKSAVDLALDVLARPDIDDSFRTPIGSVLTRRWGYRDAELVTFWRAMLSDENDDFVTQAVRAMLDPRWPDMTDLLVPLFERARREAALDGEDAAENEAALGQQIVSAFKYQPWSAVESAVIDACFDPVAHPDLRSEAARLLVGRVSKAGRKRLLTWLVGQGSARGGDRSDKPEGATADGFLQELIAVAIGTGGGAPAGGALYETLDRELRAYVSVAARLDPDLPRAFDLAPRAGALAHGIVRAGHEPSIRGLVDLLFLPELGVFSTTSASRQRALVNPGGLATPLDPASPLDTLRHEGPDLYRVLPPEAEAVLIRTAAAPDAVLAAAFTDALSAARRDGAIAMFPDLYLLKVSQALRDGREHERRPAAAEVVETFAESLAPPDSVADYAMARQQVEAHVRAGRYPDALRSQRRVVEIVSRRGYRDDEGTLWLHERVRLDAVRGMDYVSRGLGVLARDAFRSAVMRAPDDVGTLSIVAFHRAGARFDLDLAEAEARRAVALETRSLGEPRLETLDVLADVLLARGLPVDAIDLLAPRLEGKREGATHKNARFYLRLAIALLAAGEREAAETELVKALAAEPGLLEEALRHPDLEPLRADGGLDSVRARVRLARREGL